MRAPDADQDLGTGGPGGRAAPAAPGGASRQIGPAGEPALPTLSLAAAPGRRAALAVRGGEILRDPARAARAFREETVLVAHAGMTARRLGLPEPARSPRLYDLLELFAFVRPASFAAPSAVGLARALGAGEPRGIEAEAALLPRLARRLLSDLGETPSAAVPRLRREARRLEAVAWPWARLVLGALPLPSEGEAEGPAFDVLARLPPLEDAPPLGEPGSRPVPPEEAAARLRELLQTLGLDEARPEQALYAEESAWVFGPREREGAPRVMLAEAGTGVGKTLGYLAPASAFAERNGATVWLSTYTRALQRQIERESRAVFPDPAERTRRVVVRKGRENYLCLLNLEESLKGALRGAGDLVGAALTLRWVETTRDGDLTGGDFPAWLPDLFANAGAFAPAALVDRRGECVHAACPHYRTCFVEKAVRSSRRADLVIANHALVLTHAAAEGGVLARSGRDEEGAGPKRIVFDEGHHLFDAADAAFSACLSGAEAAELRRWVRGPEGRRRGRGLEPRLGDLLYRSEAAAGALSAAVSAAAALPGDGWSQRIAPQGGQRPSPSGPLETFFCAVLAQLAARADPRQEGTMECAVQPATEAAAIRAAEAEAALQALEAPLLALTAALEDLLEDESEDLGPAERSRVEGALRGLRRRARMQLPAWRLMLREIAAGPAGEASPGRFVDWFEGVFSFGRLADAAYRRHYVDPTEPLETAVLRPAHGVLVTSATLADAAHEEPFAVAELRSGAARLEDSPKLLRLASPFDYAAQSLALVVNDLPRDDPRAAAAALRALFLASRGGALGLFTSIRRLRGAYERLVGPLAEAGLPLYAQHVDPLEVSALIDVFRAEEDACLLGTDAVRDGVDVPGRSLRLLAFDKVPWPRPDLLHKARRERFGGRAFDDHMARARIAQAFGRLIRRRDDRGVFVMLDAAAPTRLFSGLPEGVELRRVGLREATDAVAAFLGSGEGAP